MDCRCIGLTVYCRDFPGAAAITAESPIASTQGGVGKFAAAAAAGALTGFDPGNRTTTIEHSYDRSGPGQPLPASGFLKRHLLQDRPMDSR